jgi:hypothetical protein
MTPDGYLDRLCDFSDGDVAKHGPPHLFWFGLGSIYSSFRFSKLLASSMAGDACSVTATVTVSSPSGVVMAPGR